MEKQKDNNIEVSVNKMYQLLIAECRYGYIRNNHLMPSCAYDDVKHFLPEILSQDVDCALTTAKQLCEECISNQLLTNFYNGEDDELEHRKEAIEFIEYLLDFIQGLDSSFKPYNYDSYQENVEKTNSIKYSLYKLKDKLDYLDPDSSSLQGNKDLLISNLSKKEVKDYLFDKILNASAIEFNKLKVHDKKETRKVVGEYLRINTPIEHKSEVYLIIKDQIV